LHQKIWQTEDIIQIIKNESIIYYITSENATSVSESEITKLTRHATETADFYAKRFMDYMDDNLDLYPDYIGSQDGGMYPERDVNFTGWVL